MGTFCLPKKCGTEVAPGKRSYPHVSREAKSPNPMAMAVESYGYFLPAGNVAMVLLKGSGVTPMAMAVDACAKVATKVRG